MSGLMFSVVIPTFNRCKELLECLDSLSQQLLPPTMFEVIVVDDGSTDETESILGKKSYKFGFTYLRQENSGPSQARNTGAAQAKAPILAFTEDDVFVREEWLSNARNAFEGNSIDILEGRTVYRGTNSDVRRFEPEQRPSFIPCNLFVKTDLFKELGGYDRSYFDSSSGLYFREDADFGFRALSRGCRFKISPDVIVEHPVQFMDVKSCSRHVSRYFFDPLLYKRHSSRYRSMIEVKQIAGMTIHRPQHYIAVLYGCAMSGGIIALMTGKITLIVFYVGIMFLCGLAFRFKYRGKLTFDPSGLVESFKFFTMPLQYLYAFLRGCFRFKSFGAIA